VSAGAPRDRDQDGLPDRWERKNHLSPTTPSAKRDPDGDHLSNRRELRLRTYPRRADTDRDRLRDGAEVRRFHTNPRKRDTDGDGFRDRCELRKGTNPRKRRSHPKRRCSKALQEPPRHLAPPPPEPGPSSCEPSPEPKPVTGQGYALRFSDCFNTWDRTVWCSNQWWESAPRAGSQFVSSDGVLHLLRRRAEGFANTTVSTEPCGQANPRSFNQGYFEVRMKFDTVRGNGPAFWLLTTRHQQNSVSGNWPNISPYCAQNGLPRAECLSSELDVFEGFGNIQYGGARQDDFFSGALHRNTSGWYGEPDSVRSVMRGTGLEMEQYHTYAARWTSSQVCYYIDGQQQGCINTFDSTNQPMHLLLYNWNTNWEDENMPNASTPDTLDVSVDWVRVWQQ
jgi:beta-glucanase (GH16 family)